MDYIFVFTGGFVVGVFLFKRELLIEEKSFKVMLGISVALFLVGIVIHSIEAGRDLMSGALLAPIASLSLFRLCRKVFIKQFNREPKDTFLNWDAGLAADRVFNIVYFTLASLLVMVTMAVMWELKKVGW